MYTAEWKIYALTEDGTRIRQKFTDEVAAIFKPFASEWVAQSPCALYEYGFICHFFTDDHGAYSSIPAALTRFSSEHPDVTFLLTYERVSRFECIHYHVRGGRAEVLHGKIAYEKAKLIPYPPICTED